MKPKLIVILSRIPYPLEKGDKLRAYHQIRELSHEFRIYLFALNNTTVAIDKAKKALNPFCQEIHFIHRSKCAIGWNMMLAFLKGQPVQLGYFYTKKAHRSILKNAQRIAADYVYCQLIRTAELAKGLQGIKTIDYQDVFSKGVERRIKKAPFYLKGLFRMEYKRLLQYEQKVFDCFEHKTIISKPDRDLIPHPNREQIHIIPNGVDYTFFSPQKNSEKKVDLVFTGNMSYPPNINSAEFLALEILPEVHKIKAGVSLMIAGASPHPRVQALASEYITATGWMDDIRDAYNQSRIFIAPMQIGTGLQNKLLEAMSMKLPGLTSALANDALGAKEGEELLIGSNAASYASHIIHLLENKAFADEIASKGQAFVHQHYDWKSATLVLAGIIKEKK